MIFFARAFSEKNIKTSNQHPLVELFWVLWWVGKYFGINICMKYYMYYCTYSSILPRDFKFLCGGSFLTWCQQMVIREEAELRILIHIGSKVVEGLLIVKNFSVSELQEMYRDEEYRVWIMWILMLGCKKVNWFHGSWAPLWLKIWLLPQFCIDWTPA